MAIDRRIMPPNFSNYYHLFDISGYDPLYIKRYGELIAAWGRSRPDISPASFNRIITPQDYSSPFTDLLGVKYILSLKDEVSPKLSLLEGEGETRLYENINVLPRAFFVNKVLNAQNDQDEIEKLYSIQNQFDKYATTQQIVALDDSEVTKEEHANILSYKDNQVKLKTSSIAKRLLILTDIYYPTWKAYLDGKETTIYRVDYTLRGIVVPSGQHEILFKNSLF